MADEHGVSESTIKRGVNILLAYGILKKTQKRSTKGKFLFNEYTLTDKSAWKEPVGLYRPADNRRSLQTSTVGLYRPNKDTHYKDTHIYNQPEADENKKFSSLKEIIGNPKIRNGGATYEWQEYATRMWKNLKIKGSPSPSWFKLFKKAFEIGKAGLLNATYAAVADANPIDPEKYFYKAFYQRCQK
jgi:hypothetical protein